MAFEKEKFHGIEKEKFQLSTNCACHYDNVRGD